jgi:hypothetical protein
VQRLLGSVLDVNGDGFADVVVGAHGAMSHTGRVHVYLGSAAGPGSAPAQSLTGPDGANGRFGYWVASWTPSTRVRDSRNDFIERLPRAKATPAQSAPAQC